MVLSPKGLKTAVVVGPGVALSRLSSTRTHFFFPSYRIYFSLEKHPCCLYHPWPPRAPRQQDSCCFPPPSLCPCSALMPWAPSCTGGYWDCGSWPAFLPCSPGC